MAGDIYDELSSSIYTMAAMTTALVEIRNEKPPAGDIGERLNFALEQLARYQRGVDELYAKMNHSFDTVLAVKADAKS